MISNKPPLNFTHSPLARSKARTRHVSTTANNIKKTNSPSSPTKLVRNGSKAFAVKIRKMLSSSSTKPKEYLKLGPYEGSGLSPTFDIRSPRGFGHNTTGDIPPCNDKMEAPPMDLSDSLSLPSDKAPDNNCKTKSESPSAFSTDFSAQSFNTLHVSSEGNISMSQEDEYEPAKNAISSFCTLHPLLQTLFQPCVDPVSYMNDSNDKDFHGSLERKSSKKFNFSLDQTAADERAKARESARSFLKEDNGNKVGDAFRIMENFSEIPTSGTYVFAKELVMIQPSELGMSESESSHLKEEGFSSFPQFQPDISKGELQTHAEEEDQCYHPTASIPADHMRYDINHDNILPGMGNTVDKFSLPQGNFSREEVEKVYPQYRLNREYVESIMKHMDCTIPAWFVKNSTVNVCSEPKACTLKVRGPNYTNDNIKIPSQEGMFSVLGVDSILRNPDREPSEHSLHCCAKESSFRSRLAQLCNAHNITVPFLLVIHLVVPWGNLQAYLYRPDGTNGGPFNDDKIDSPAENAWRNFLNGDADFRYTKLKMIPRIVAGPWMIRKMVGSNPAMIAQKLPTSYFGSLEENYLEICMDVTRGGSVANSISNAVVGKADMITVDLGFVVEGNEVGNDLPEQVLGVFRLHHVAMKKTLNNADWVKEVKRRMTERGDVIL